MPILAVLAILALLGGGTSLAARSALPGDVLYPVKTHVNEAVEELFTFSPAAKARLETQLALERLEEAERLAAEGRLNENAKSEIESNFNVHSNNVDDLVKALENTNQLSDAAELSSEIESSLRTHSRILDSLHVNSIAEKADSEANDAEKQRVELETKISESSGPESQEAAEEKLSEVKSKINEVREFIAEHRDRLGPDVLAQVEAKLASAESKVAEGQTSLQSGDYGTAFVLFEEAERIAQEAKLLAQAKDELKLEVKTSDEAENESEVEASSTNVTSSSEEREQGNVHTEKGSADIRNEINDENKAETSSPESF